MSQDRSADGLADEFVARLARPLLEAAELAQMGIAVSVVDGDAVNRVYVSAAAACILGHPAEELVGRPTFLSFPPEEAERMRELSERWQRGEPVPHFLESVVLGKNGARTSVEVAFSRVELDGKPATVSFLRDITDRKRTEDALKKSEGLFRELVEAAPEAVTVSRAGVIFYANPRFLQMLGYDSMQGLVSAGIELVHPDDRALIADHRQAIFGSSATEPREYRLLHARGGIVTVECSALAIAFEGEPAVLTFMRDVTKRKEAQAHLIQTERMATIGTLAAGVAHELNNPLAYIMLNLHSLETELDDLLAPVDRERIRETLQTVRQGTAQMASIVRDLRGFCRPDAPPRPIDVRQVLESAIHMAMAELQNRARLVRDYSPVRCVLADGARLGQVFLNLLLNAAHAIAEGDPNHNEVRVVLKPQGTQQLKIEITDSGHGIAPELHGRIFEPFFTTKPPAIGTGLGLSISQSIVNNMNGQISVESTPGRGSTFRVLLPTTELACDRIEPVDEPALAGCAPERPRLLIIDDERALARALQEELATDHDVMIATSGAQALELLLGDAVFDVILCDVLMRGMTGIELYQTLQRQRPDLVERVIFITGGQSPMVGEFFARVPNARVDKPFDLPRLRALIREVAARSHAP